MRSVGYSEAELPPAVAGRWFLRDGTEVWVRPLLPSDRDLAQEFVRALAPEGLEARYFGTVRSLLAGETGAFAVPTGDRLCLLVLGERPNGIAILGVGEYARLSGGGPLAEVTVVVEERSRGLGVASVLLARLARAARAFGILRFLARIRSANPEMLELFRASGLRFTEERLEDEVDVIVPIVPDADLAPAPRAAEPDRARRRHGSRRLAA